MKESKLFNFRSALIAMATAAIALTATPAHAGITVVGSSVKGYVDSTKASFATAHLGTTLVSYNATGVSKLVVAISGEPGNNNQVLTFTGVKFNGTAMTQAVHDNTRVTSSNDDGDVAIYYLDNPFQGAATFSFTASSTSGVINGGVVTIIGLAGTASGVGNTGKSSFSSPTAASTPSTSITTSAANSLVIAAVQNSGINNSAAIPTVVSPLSALQSGNWGSSGGWGSFASGSQAVTTSGTTITPTFNTVAGGNIHVIAAEFQAPLPTLSWNTGDGTWDTSATNWLDSSLATVAYADGLSAVLFDDASAATGNPAVTLNSTFSPLAVTMKSASHDYTISGAGAITGSMGLTLDATNTKTLTLSTLNSFTGNVAVNGGTLVANATETSTAAPLGAANNTRTITVSTGATLQLAQAKALKALFSSSNVPSLIINGTVNDTNLSNPGNNPLGNVTLNNGTLTASVGNANGYGSYNLNGTVTSTGTSLISSTASVPITLSAATGNTTPFNVTSGTLTVSAALGQVTASGDAQVSGLTKTGAGALTLSGTNSYTGLTTVTVGTLNASGTDVLGTGAPLLLNGGTLALSSFSSAVGAVTLTSGSITGSGGTLTGTSFTVDSGSASAILGGVGTTLTKATSGTVTLTGVNAYTGATLVSGGTLTLSGSGEVNGSSGITVDGSGAKLLQTSSAAVSPTVTLTNGTLTGSGMVNSVIVGNATGGIVSNNDGVAGAALTVGALTFNGAATVNTFGNASAPIVTTSLASNGAGTVTINPTATSWTIGAVYDLISYGGGSITGAGFPQFALGPVTGLGLRQTATLGDSGTAITLTIGGVDGSPYWVGDGDSKWNLASTSNWKLITSGNYTKFYATDVVLFDDNATAAGPLNVDIDAANVATTSTTFNNSTKDYTLTGAFGISAGSLIKNGTAGLTISTANTYNGGTSITAGTVKLSGAGTPGAAGSAVAVSSGALLDLNGTNQSIKFTAGTGVGTVANNSGSGTSTLTLSGTSPINGGLVTIVDNTNSSSGKVAVVITANTTTLSNANTYSGGTTVNAGAYIYLTGAPLGAGTGTINLPSYGGTGATSSGLVVDGTTYANDITGAGYVHSNANSGATVVTTTLTGNINTSGPFIFRAGTGIVYDFAGNGTTSVLSGVIGSTTSMVNGAVATGSIKKSGTGTLTLSGTNVYTGTTTVIGGTLNLAGSSSGTLGAIKVGNTATPGGSTLNISAGSYTQGAGGFYVGVDGGPGTVNQTGGSVTWNSTSLELLVGNGSAGTYNLSGGTLTTLTGTSNRGVMLGVNGNSTQSFNLSGTGTLNVAGTSALSINRFDATSGNSNSTFSQTGGTATIGVLTMGGPVAQTTAENNTAILTLTGGTFTATTWSVLSAAAGDTSTINIGGTAVVTLPAFPTVRGTGSTATINFDGGTLKPAAASATYMGGLTNAFIKAGGAQFDTTNGSITITQNLLTDTGSLNGGLTKAGSNTLTLSGTNTYTGATTVNAGTLTLGNANPGNDASTVTIAASGATLDLTYAGTDKVDKLFIGTTQMAAGVYGPTAINIPQITNSTGSGTLTVFSGPAVGFSSWITGTFAGGATVPSGLQGPNDDPDNDGIKNLIEYAITGQDPTVGNAAIGTFTANTLSFTKRDGTTGLTYAIVQSTDLGVLVPWSEVPTGPTYTNNATTISYTLTPGTPVKNFVRLKVAQP